MKVAIPTEEKRLDANVCTAFGRAPVFLIYDTDTEAEVYLDNPAQRTQGGAGVQAGQIIADERVDAVIAWRLGRNAADVMQAAGIKTLGARNGSLQANIQAMLDDELEILGTIHAGFHCH